MHFFHPPPATNGCAQSCRGAVTPRRHFDGRVSARIVAHERALAVVTDTQLDR